MLSVKREARGRHATGVRLQSWLGGLLRVFLGSRGMVLVLEVLAAHHFDNDGVDCTHDADKVAWKNCKGATRGGLWKC